MAYLRSIRPLNLLLLAYAQLLIKYSVFPAFGVTGLLPNFQFSILVLATLSIAAGGYVINDIYDREIDRINKPNRVWIGMAVSERRATQFYIVLTGLGVVLGFYVSHAIDKPGFASIFVVIAAALYIYTSYLKSILLVGNIAISMLVSLGLLIVPIFDLLPVTNVLNQALHQEVFILLLYYAAFAFGLNFIREIVKDLQDIDGDKNGGRNTLPIAIGRSRTVTFVWGLAVLHVIGVLTYMYGEIYARQTLVLYFLFLVVAPLLYFCVKCYGAKRKAEFAQLAIVAKIIFLTGLSSLWLYPLEGLP
ncbi:MAG: prenyltransferase [Flavobacteriaceae bacterium]|nr:prenyltransferase [Flavobacteriaceae bacterium]